MKLAKEIARTALSVGVIMGIIYGIGSQDLGLLAVAGGFLWWCW